MTERRPSQSPPGSADAGWEKLQAIRKARIRTPSIGSGPELRRLFLAEVPEMRRMKKQLGILAEAWARYIPADLAARTRLEGVARGVLRVGVTDAATAYELDRVLRSGAERAMLAGTPVSLRSVRVVVSSDPGGT